MTTPRELVERLRERAEQIGMPGGLSHDLHVEAASEITRLRGLLEEAKGVLGRFAMAWVSFSGLADSIEVRLDGSFKVQNRDAMLLTPPASVSVGDLRAASSLLKRLEGE